MPNSYDIVINLAGYINHKNKSLALKTHYNGCKNCNFFYKRNMNLYSGGIPRIW